MRKRPDRLILTCEHAGNRIPRQYASLFLGARRLLSSHRGWDPGALDVARFLARHFRIPLRSVTWSRLLVEPNRAPSNPRIWSRFTAGLPIEERKRILERYWWPHRLEVQEAIRRIVADHRRAVHIAVHSFTPLLDGKRRNADVGLLYDPHRSGEKTFCRHWQEVLKERAPKLRVRRNYPYPGVTDGFPTWLRRRFSGRNYVGLELELNQALLASPRRNHLERLLAQTIATLLQR
jgi:predicted N-formylglutamate amidohydrolase